jgi:hypothetical protein
MNSFDDLILEFARQNIDIMRDKSYDFWDVNVDQLNVIERSLHDWNVVFSLSSRDVYEIINSETVEITFEELLLWLYNKKTQ